MIVRHARSAALVLAALGALGTAGCTRIQQHQGYVADEALITAIQPGVDNRDSVLQTLGRPTFTGQFAANDWYYVSRLTKNLAFATPRANSQTVLRVRFDEAGNVATVDRRGVEQVASITPSDDKTPTLGRDTNLLEELFGNIGAVGSGGMTAPTGGAPR
ncbi:MAG TPA: outer membrane protein assembly factor BamE [Allosphingosinicella sp.]|nr:outer membrane protein assembly factor BamE [Allosphingosinicella sp.]